MPLLGDYILSWEEMAWICREMVKQQRKVLAKLSGTLPRDRREE
jgi:hypothetical protein